MLQNDAELQLRVRASHLQRHSESFYDLYQGSLEKKIREGLNNDGSIKIDQSQSIGYDSDFVVEQVNEVRPSTIQDFSALVESMEECKDILN
jgi:hypothetical protein